MNKEELQALLDKIRSEAERADTLDEKERELLHSLNEEIHKLLAVPETAGSSPVRAQIDELLSTFEARHPSLVAALTQMLDSLSNAGI